ncbi:MULTISPECIES: DsrH/TusB family sulfur relay protein [unclassified Pseudoalteromonas]|uniref:DsrH/TusB family sulfur relay protein n=1 Tax=unclassified Pseudoalteromonas TaxID=194690 RepID=UPI0005A94349|nr:MULTISPECIES: DsrH/TusB family sulfur metabolism protein [unclassified Pseudoalteromonas]
MTDLTHTNATLHILSKPVTQTQFQELLDLKNESDSVLFTRDACYSLLAPYIDLDIVIAIQADCEARGINNKAINGISYEKWVELALEYKNTLSW